MYKVIVNGVTVKEYPYKIQAIIYCILNGYVYSGYDEWKSWTYIRVLDNRVKIEHENS